jgi:hypothetical protein
LLIITEQTWRITTHNRFILWLLGKTSKIRENIEMKIIYQTMGQVKYKKEDKMKNKNRKNKSF